MSQSLDFNRDMYTQFARAQVFLPKAVLGFLALGKFFLEELVSWLTRPVEVFLRYRMGIRNHSLFHVLQLASIAVSACTASGPHDSLFSLFCALSGIAALYHWVEAYRFEKVGKTKRFSWSAGDPLPFWEYAVKGLERCGIKTRKWVTVERICLIGEPLLVLLLGFALRPFSQVLGIFLQCSAGALFFKAIIIQQRMMNMKRDQWDARILSEFLIGVHKEGSPAGKREFHVVRLATDVGPEVRPMAPTQQVPVAAPVMSIAALVSSTTWVGTGPPESDERVTTAEHLRSACTGCGHRFRVNKAHAGKIGRCRRCGNSIAVPAVETAAA